MGLQGNSTGRCIRQCTIPMVHMLAPDRPQKTSQKPQNAQRPDPPKQRQKKNATVSFNRTNVML